KSDRLSDAHGKLIRHLSRSSEAVQSSSFAGRVVSAIDSFLHITAGLFQDLAHFAGHVSSEAILIADQNLAEAKQNFGALGSWHAAPTVEGALRGIDGCVHIVAGGKLEATDDVFGVGRINVLKHFTGFTRDPLAANVVVVGFYGRARRRSGVLLRATFREGLFCLSHGISFKFQVSSSKF